MAAYANEFPTEKVKINKLLWHRSTVCINYCTVLKIHACDVDEEKKKKKSEIRRKQQRANKPAELTQVAHKPEWNYKDLDGLIYARENIISEQKIL